MPPQQPQQQQNPEEQLVALLMELESRIQALEDKVGISDTIDTSSEAPQN